MNHFKNSIIFGTFLGLVTASSVAFFVAFQLPLKCVGELVFDDDFDYPIPACLEALLGEREASQV